MRDRVHPRFGVPWATGARYTGSWWSATSQPAGLVRLGAPAQ